MWLALIDESGKATPKESSPFVIAAFIINDELLQEIESTVVKIKLEEMPGINPKAEIHAKDITHGKGAFRNFRLEDRKRLLDGLTTTFLR